ncbi:MAG TPA: hypothetical protein VFM55_22215 [Micromonosporaceae bacterium]|nr:hypothetical protein [Micromonosporaceae bacterium]
MPSHLHEVLIEMFRDRPALVADLLASPLGVALPEFHKARVSAGELTDVMPTEYRADAVITLDVADTPVFAVVVEVQLRIDARKRYTWPAYVATLHARLERPVMLLVVCPDRAVAAWCATPIVVTDPGLTLTPVVLGPRQVPVVTDAGVARRHPELTILSVLTHGARQDPPAVFEALLAALDVIDRDHADLYTDLVLTALPAAARVLLEEFMTTATHRYQSDFARRYFSQGEAQGEARGEARGEAKGEAKALLAILDARGVHVPDDIRAGIVTCTDLAQLESWIRRAATADKIHDVLD